MRLIFLGQAEGSRSGVSGPDGWWGMSRKRSDPAQLPLSLYRVRIACEMDSCLSVVSRVKMQRSVDQRYAIKFCVKLKKIHDRDACYDTESLREGCFIESTSVKVAQSVQRRERGCRG